MATFDVDVSGVTYEVDAPDERTAWRWANATHSKAASKPAGKFPVDVQPAMPTGAEFLAANPVTRLAVGAASPFIGLAQLGAHALGKGEGIDDTIKTFEKMKTAGGHEGFDLAGLAGAVASPAAALTKLPMAATRGARVAQGAAIGAGVGASTPVTEDIDFWIAKSKQAAMGGALGPVIPAAISGVAKGVEVVRNVLPGGTERIVGGVLNKAAGDKRPAILDALKRNQQIVPGSQAAAGEVAAPAGSAEFSGLQRIAAMKNPTPYRDVEQAQDAARLAAVRSVGQDKATLEAAQSARAANAATNYGKAYEQAIKADPDLAMISKNPYFQDALPDALKLAEARGISSKTDLTQFLQYVKISLDKAVSKTGDSALSNSERQAVQMVKGRLTGWLGKKNPAYEAARAAFAAESKPINQMEVGQYLEGKLVPALNDSGATANQRGAMYAQAVRDAPGTLKRATGFNRYDDIADVLNPGQTQAVRSVGQDLGRKAEHEDLARRGVTAASEIIDLSIPKVPAAGMFNPKYSVAKSIINRLAGKMENRALKMLSEKMQDPKEIARVMENLSPQDRKAVIEDWLHHSGRLATVGGAAGLARLQ